MGSRRRRFSDEFKREAVRLAYDGKRSLAEVSRDLDVRPDMIRRWRRKLSSEGSRPREEDTELTRLRHELRDVREERDILKNHLVRHVQPSGPETLS